MARGGRRWTPQEVARLTATRGVAARPRRRPLTYGVRWGQQRSSQTPEGWKLVYDGWLPRISGHQVNRFARSRLAKLARERLGTLPPGALMRAKALVEIIRVLGPRQRDMDDDSIAALVSGLRDALKRCHYIVDDSPTWSTFVYRNDGTRRPYGPYIEVLIRHEEAR